MTKLNNLNLEVANNMENLNENIQEIFSLIFNGFYKGNSQNLEQADQKIRGNHKLLDQVQEYISTDSSFQPDDVATAATIISHYQKILFDLEKISTYTNTKNKEGILFTEKAVTELDEMFRGIKNFFTHLNDIILTGNPVLIDYLLKEKTRYKQLAKQFTVEHEDRLIKGICLARSSSLYLYLMDAFEDILWHIQAIVNQLKE